MKTSIISTLLFTLTALSAPITPDSDLGSLSPITTERSLPDSSSTDLETRAAGDFYWSGLTHDTPPSGASSFTQISSMITAPALKFNPTGKPTQVIYTWIGLNGGSCAGAGKQNALFQAGIQAIITKDGRTAYYPWYEWFPAPIQFFQGINVKAGDQLFFTVSRDSANAGTATVENWSTGQSASASVSNSAYPLCAQSAEWVVENVALANKATHTFSLPDFGTQRFVGAMVRDSNGVVADAAKARVIELQQDGRVQTLSRGAGSGVVSVKFVQA